MNISAGEFDGAGPRHLEDAATRQRLATPAFPLVAPPLLSCRGVDQRPVDGGLGNLQDGRRVAAADPVAQG